MSRPFALIVSAAAFAWAAAPAAAQEAFALKATVPSITTQGEASAEVVPNVAILSFGVETERKSATDAAEENAKASQAVIADVRASGVEARDVRTLGVTLAPVYDETLDQNGRVTRRTLRGYRARNDLTVRVRQIERAGALARQWIEKGAHQFGGVTFDYDQKEPRLEALRGEAVRDALRKATSYTNGLGIKLGRVLEIAPAGGFARPVPMAMAARADKAEAAQTAIPIEPGVQTLRVEVEVAWELAQ